jgi:hypothetical protein
MIFSPLQKVAIQSVRTNIPDSRAVRTALLFACLARAKAENDAGRHARTVERSAAGVDADVIKLRTECQVTPQAQVNSAAHSKANPLVEAEIPLAPAVR